MSTISLALSIITFALFYASVEVNDEKFISLSKRVDSLDSHHKQPKQIVSFMHGRNRVN